MNEEPELGAMNHHVGESLFPQGMGKQCSCLCWKEVVALRRVVTMLSMKIERHSRMIDEIKLSRQRRSNTDFVEEEQEVETKYPHHHQSPVIPKNEIESSQVLDDQEEQNESHFDFNSFCETSMVTETEEESMSTGSSFMSKHLTPSSSSSSSYLRIGTSSLQIVNPSSQLEDSGGYDFIREDSDSEKSETTFNESEPSHRFFQNMSKKSNVDFENRSINISNTSTEHPIVCRLCPNQPVFKTESNLKYHNRHFHTGVPEEFPCKICGRKFPYRGGLTYHMKSVHLGRRFQCPVPGCKSYYTTKSKLCKHQKKERHGSGYIVISVGETSSNNT